MIAFIILFIIARAEDYDKGTCEVEWGGLCSDELKSKISASTADCCNVSPIQPPCNQSICDRCFDLASRTLHPYTLSRSSKPNWGGVVCHRCDGWGDSDPMFDHIKSMQKWLKKPWGKVLDAGTGKSSLTWLQTLDMDSWVAITGSTSMKEDCERVVVPEKRDLGYIIKGLWSDPSLLAHQVFDAVLADYLIGAVEGFQPYAQDDVFPQIRTHMKTGSTIYVVGYEPFPPIKSLPADFTGERLLVQAANYRDACQIAAGVMPYREFPLDWYIKEMTPIFDIIDVSNFAVVYGPRWVESQVSVGDNYAKQLTPALREAFLAQGRGIVEAAWRDQSLLKGVCFGSDFVISGVVI